MMRTISSILSALVLTVAATARAQSAPTPEKQTDLSQINGQLVPVGDHNQYHYDFKRWNVSSNPLGWVFGSYGASLSYGFHPNLALRGDVNFYQPVDTNARGFELGVGLPIYLRRTYQGAFLEPGLISRRFEDDSGYATTTFGPQVLIGWHWMWDSGLNVAVAVGAGRNWATRGGDDYHDSSESIFANGYLRFGYAF